MYLYSLATGTPPTSYTQQETWQIFASSRVSERLRPGSVELVRRVLTGNSGIEKRHFALPEFGELLNYDGEQLNHAFEREAPLLGGRVLGDALDRAEWRARDLDALIVCSCTGYLCPGLSSFIAERQGLAPDAYLLDVVGQGCGAAIPAMRAASHIVDSRPAAKVAVVAVEICTAAFYIDDEAGVLISFCLFGDGAAATLWSGLPQADLWRAREFNSLHFPEKRELLRFENSKGRLRNKLHPSIPEESSAAVRKLYAASFLNGARPDVLISHGGGRKVLDAIEAGMEDFALREARTVLRNCGNMSSPSVLFALEEYFNNGNSAHSRDLWLTSFGAGFSVHGMRLRRG